MAGRTLVRAPASPFGPIHQAVVKAAARVLDHVAASWGENLLPNESVEEREAWFYFEHVSEVSTLLGGSAGLQSQVIYTIGRYLPDGSTEFARDPKTGEIRAGLDAQTVVDAEDSLRRYTDAAGSRASIQFSQSQCWGVAGDGYLIGYPIDAEGRPVREGAPNQVSEEFRFVALGALHRHDNPDMGYVLQESRLGPKLVLPPETVIRRMTRPHPRFPGEGLGWVKSALEPCRDIYFFTLAQRAAGKSNIPADVWLVPAEATPKDPTQPGWGPGADSAIADGNGPAGGQDGKQSFAAYLEQMLGAYVTNAVAKAGEGGGVTPAFLSITEQLIDKFAKLSFSRPIDAQLAELVKQARTRLAETADGSPESLQGLGQTSRWNGEKIGEDEYRRYVKPTVDASCAVWTAGVLYPEMRSKSYTQSEFEMLCVVPNPAPIILPADKSVNASEGIRLGAIGYRTWREVNDYDDSDAPTEDDIALMERMRLVPDSHASNGTGRGDQGPPATTKPVDKTKGAATTVTASAARSLEGLSDRLLRIEDEATARLQEAAEAALDDALKRAGAKLRNWAKASASIKATLPARITTVDARDVGGLLGPARCLELATAKHAEIEQRHDDLFAAAIVALLAAFERIVRQAYVKAERAYGVQVAQADVDHNVERAKDALRSGMYLTADRELFGNVPTPEGEWVDGVKVPVIVLRIALAIAGGAVVKMALFPGPDMAELPTFNGTTATASLVFGPTFAKLAPPTSGMRWAYGDEYRSETFQPHADLDGQHFTSQRDPVLAGSPFTTFDGFYWAPDHGGCRCHVVPVHDNEEGPA